MMVFGSGCIEQEENRFQTQFTERLDMECERKMKVNGDHKVFDQSFWKSGVAFN